MASKTLHVNGRKQLKFTKTGRKGP